MAKDTENGEYFENLTSVSRELVFAIKNLRGKINGSSYLSVWSFFIMISTIYSDGVEKLIFKTALTFFIVTFLFFNYFIIKYFSKIREFNVSLQTINTKKTTDSNFDNLVHSRY